MDKLLRDILREAMERYGEDKSITELISTQEELRTLPPSDIRGAVMEGIQKRIESSTLGNICSVLEEAGKEQVNLLSKAGQLEVGKRIIEVMKKAE